MTTRSLVYKNLDMKHTCDAGDSRLKLMSLKFSSKPKFENLQHFIAVSTFIFYGFETHLRDVFQVFAN